MDDALGRGRYVEPRITDHGDLVALTSTMPLLYGPAADSTRDMSFSGTPSGGGGTTSAAGGSTPAAADPAITPATNGAPTTVGGGHVPAGTTPTGGGGAPYAGGGAGGDPGGGSLPFSGYAAGVVAAIGTGLVALGAGVRRAVRGSRISR